MTDPEQALPPMTAHPLDPGLAAGIRDLVTEGTLTGPQAARVAEVLSAGAARHRSGAPDAAEPAGGRGGRLAELAGYLGAALLLGAAALFLTSGWADLSETARVLTLAALAGLLLLAGAAVAATSGVPLRALGRSAGSARRRLVSVLWTAGATSAAAAAGLQASSQQLLVASAVGLAVGAAAYAVVPGVVGQLGLWAGSITFVVALVDQVGDQPGSPAYGLSLLALGLLWVALGLAGLARYREPALATGAALGLVAAQLPVLDGDRPWVAYLLTGLVAAGGFAGHLATRSWSVLAVGVLATTLVVPEALHDWTDGSVSAAGTLLVAGLTLLSASALGLRLRQDGTRRVA